jgi:6-phosphogluconolactonase
LFRFADEAQWIEAGLDAFRGIFRQAISLKYRQQDQSLHISLSGGSTPMVLYKTLATDPDCSELTADLDVHFWVGDEREVPADSSARNGTMIRRAFFEGCGWKKRPRLHLWPEGEREKACLLYAEELRRAMGDRPVFDLVILGMGQDGHTAGLFTLGDIEKGGKSGFCLSTTAPSEPVKRMTMSARLLKEGRNSLVLLKGEEKKAVLEALLAGSARMPIREVLNSDSRIFHLC